MINQIYNISHIKKKFISILKRVYDSYFYPKINNFITEIDEIICLNGE
tara:strand:+ start:406 stop:549 length:144 start_codon:yes stop_codon:yes gene_type:complete